MNRFKSGFYSHRNTKQYTCIGHIKYGPPEAQMWLLDVHHQWDFFSNVTQAYLSLFTIFDVLYLCTNIGTIN